MYTMWGPQTIAKLVYNSNNYGLWYTNNYSSWGLQTIKHNWGAHMYIDTDLHVSFS